MQISDILLWATGGSALMVSVAGVLKDRRVPQLTAAQANSETVSAEQVKIEIKRLTDVGNIWRDLRILDLERWGDAMRPWASAVARRDDQMVALIKEDRLRCNLPMPDLEPLPPVPPFPEPRPRPD